MTDRKKTADDSAGRGVSRNATVAFACAGAVVGMVGLAFASVPLYSLFCQVTGYGGTTQVSDGNDGVTVLDREINVRFDANVAPGLPWQFTPAAPVRLRIGEMQTISYRARNVSDRATTGTATFNVAPAATGAYFSKIACFCFNQQTLEPGEEVEMGVTFYVDPAIIDDADTSSVRTITLSYTFFEAANPVKPVATAPAVPPNPT